jgi:carbon storage regulator
MPCRAAIPMTNYGPPVMLVLSRRVGETLKIGPDVQVSIVAVHGEEVRLSVVAPPALLPAAEEVHERAGSKPGAEHISWR